MAVGKKNKSAYESERGSGIGGSILMIFAFLVFLAILLYILYTLTIHSLIMGGTKDYNDNTEISIIIPQETESETEEEVREFVQLPDMGALQAAIEESLSTCDGNWSVYVKRLDEDDDTIMINNMVLPSASVMKIFIMGAVYDQINKGTFTRDEVYEQMAEMIGASSNAAANKLLKLLGNGSYEAGIAVVNKFIKNYGYDNGTQEYNGFEDEETMFGGTNTISALDCGAFLTDLYNGTVVSAAYSQEMLNLLSLQQTKYKIPALLPADTVIMNKTGEMDGTENDVGIVLSPGADYVICILSSEWTNKTTAISEIQQISKMVYEYFNGQIEESITDNSVVPEAGTGIGEDAVTGDGNTSEDEDTVGDGSTEE